MSTDEFYTMYREICSQYKALYSRAKSQFTELKSQATIPDPHIPTNRTCGYDTGCTIERYEDCSNDDKCKLIAQLWTYLGRLNDYLNEWYTLLGVRNTAPDTAFLPPPTFDAANMTIPACNSSSIYGFIKGALDFIQNKTADFDTRMSKIPTPSATPRPTTINKNHKPKKIYIFILIPVIICDMISILFLKYYWWNVNYRMLGVYIHLGCWIYYIIVIWKVSSHVALKIFLTFVLLFEFILPLLYIQYLYEHPQTSSRFMSSTQWQHIKKRAQRMLPSAMAAHQTNTKS